MAEEPVLPKTVTISFEDYVSLRAFKVMYEQHLQGEELGRREAREADAKRLEGSLALMSEFFNNLMGAIRAYREEFGGRR